MPDSADETPPGPVRLAGVNERDTYSIDPARVEIVTLPSAVERTIGLAFDEYAGRLKSFARAATRDDDEAEDVVADSFLRLVKEVRANRTPDNIGGWLFRVASNLLASRGRHRSVAERAKTFLVDRRIGSSPEDIVLRRDEDRTLVAALGELAPDARIALLMAGNGATSIEIAKAIGRTPNATRTFICRARLRLRQALAVVDEESR